MSKDKFDFKYVFGFIALIFFIHLLSLLSELDYSSFCLVPRNTAHLVGIITMPLLHENFEHLFSNIVSYLIVSFVLFSVYARVAKLIFWAGFIFTGVIVWCIGRADSCHIGASGLVYCLSFFLMASGFIRKDTPSLMAAIIVIVFNQGMLVGMLPFQSKISWEGHFGGAVVGVVTAYYFRNVNRTTSVIRKRTREKRRRFFEDFDF